MQVPVPRNGSEGRRQKSEAIKKQPLNSLSLKKLETPALLTGLYYDYVDIDMLNLLTGAAEVVVSCRFLLPQSHYFMFY